MSEIENNTRFINREISWLSFNERVLQEAQDPTVPLIQRLRFLGIFSNNLDEFFRVRVATVNRLYQLNKSSGTVSEEDPKRILKEIEVILKAQQIVFENTFQSLLESLKEEKIVFLNEKQLTLSQGKVVRTYFNEKIRQTLIPIMLDFVPQFPQLRDDAIYLAVKLHNGDSNKKKIYSLIEIPTKNNSRFFVIPDASDIKYIIFLDDVVRYCLDTIYSNFHFEYIEAYTFKITRDAAFDLDHGYSKSFLELMDNSIKQRKKGEAVRFVYDQKMPNDLYLYLQRKLNFGSEDTKMPGIRYHDFKNFIAFPDLGNKSLVYEKISPLRVLYLDEMNSMFKAISKKDVLLYFPYQSFDYIIDFLRESATDPKVKEIRITLYRVASNSNVINALVSAAKNGKKVTVVFELMARFDEKNNIHWSKKLIEEGITVIYGIPGYKIHSKLVLVSREEYGKIKYYANITTGNYNESTAKIYCDHSLLTCDKIITEDILNVFNLIETRNFDYQFKELLVSPKYFRDAFCLMVQNEIDNAQKGKKAYIYLKSNNIVDRGIIDKLYEASQKGVKIKLMVRGICCLISNIKGLSENIEARSIVDKYLEHSRVYFFANDGNMKIFISSADLMMRNLDERIEVTTPIKSRAIKKELLYLFESQWKDNVKARKLELLNINEYKTNSKEKYRHQDYFYTYLKEKI